MHVHGTCIYCINIYSQHTALCSPTHLVPFIPSPIPPPPHTHTLILPSPSSMQWNKSHQLFKKASDIMGYEKQQLKTMWGQFWASHQRFFKYMCIAAKVPEVIKLARKALEDGKCVVIGLQSTGEARTLEQLERNAGELTGFISTAKLV